MMAARRFDRCDATGFGGTRGSRRWPRTASAGWVSSRTAWSPRATGASSTRDLPPRPPPSKPTEPICEGRWITPGLIDCHTHLVHAGNRAREFELRLAGRFLRRDRPRRRRHRLDDARDPRRQRGGTGRHRPAPARRPDRRGRHHDRDQIGLWPVRRRRAEDAARRPRAGRCARSSSPPPSSAPMRCRPNMPAMPTAMSIWSAAR
jgi:hypothetical protein